MSNLNPNQVDSQCTSVIPIQVEKFDLDEYQDYQASLFERANSFWVSKTSPAIYRRFRVSEVFSDGCKDMKYSLSLQLGALKESMQFEADVPNFLEPWYGIGTIASAFGINYVWEINQAPYIKAPFSTVREALTADIKPVEETAIGKRTLEMIEYFVDRTKGKIPISLSDVQSPFNIASYLIETNCFFTAVYYSPDELHELLSLITELSIQFISKQIQLVGNVLVYPGHGFCSHVAFKSLGMSDDVMIMLSPKQYAIFEIPYINRLGQEFGGVAVHSCGNWSDKLASVKSIANLTAVDAAFSTETDPSPNPANVFRDALTGGRIVLNARIVGDEGTVIDTVKNLWSPGMKCIFVTYMGTPEEQSAVYKQIHEICI